MHPDDWPPAVEHELALAEDARRQGKEGRARVCARRASGMAARIYLEHRGIPVGGASVLDIFGQLVAQGGLDSETIKLIRTLQARVDTDFQLPQGVDLIAIARSLCTRLLD